MGRRPGEVFGTSYAVRRRPLPSNSPPAHAFLSTSDCSHLRLLPVPCVFSFAGGRRSVWRRRRGGSRRRSRCRPRAEPSGPRPERVDSPPAPIFAVLRAVSRESCESACLCKCAYVCRACLCEACDGSRPVSWSQGVMGVALRPRETLRSAIRASNMRNSVSRTM